MAAIFPDIVTAVDSHMRAKLKRSPCHTNRSSAIGDDCERRLVYERTHWQEKDLPDVGLQYIFDVGNTLEEPVLRMIHDSGFEIMRQQEPFQYKSKSEVLLTGHIDGVVVADDVEYLGEVKTMSPYIWQAVNTVADFQKYPWTRKYPWQLNIYMFGLEIPRGIWFLINKSTGRVKQINMELDFDLAERTLQRCERINAHIKNDTLPDFLDDADTCDKCPFQHVCSPPINRMAIDVETDAETIEMVKRMMELKPGKSEHDAIDRELKPRFREREPCIVGNYEYRGKWTSDGKQWRGSFKEITKK